MKRYESPLMYTGVALGINAATYHSRSIIIQFYLRRA